MAIRRRGSRWQVDVCISPHPRVREAAPTEDAARLLEARIIATLRSGQPWTGEVSAGGDASRPPRGTMREALDGAWSTWWAGQPLRSGMGQYRNARLVVDLFGEATPCRTITDAHMAEAIAVLRGRVPDRRGVVHKPRSEVRINRLMQSFSRIFEYARRQGWIAARPSWERNAKADRKRRMWVCSEQQEAAILAYCEAVGWSDLADLVALYLDTGARRHELCYVEADAFRPGAGGSTLLLRQTKGDRPRVVPLAERAEAILRRRCEAVGGEGRIFRGWYPDKVSKRFAEVLADVGIADQDACVHGLRHTFGTRMADAGMPVHVLMEIMGHGRVETTMLYVKASGAAVRQAFAAATRARELQRAAA